MPYGIPKQHGGDSPANVSRMERCVEDLQQKGHDKVSAIRICKAQLFGRNADVTRNALRRA